MKRLTDLDPHWLRDGERHGIGVSFECSCGCGDRMAVGFANPLDGGAPVIVTRNVEGIPTWWQRTGDTFETMSLSPSIVVWRAKKEHWHGVLQHGIVTP